MNEALFEYLFTVQERHPGYELVAGDDTEDGVKWALLFCASEHKFLYLVDDAVFTSVNDTPDDLLGEFKDAVEDHLESLNMRTFSSVSVGQFFYEAGEDKLLEKKSKSTAIYHRREDGDYRVFHDNARVRLHLG